MKISVIGAVGLTLMLLLKPALADEAGFLKSIEGSWSGNGSVTTKIGSRPFKVTCRFDSTARGISLVMSGQCRGLVVVRRAVSADIRAAGTRYSGTYIGPSGRSSHLSGSRTGNSINFIVRWSREINGDRTAQMTIEKIGARGLRLRTIDNDPKNGRLIVTSDIRLTR